MRNKWWLALGLASLVAEACSDGPKNVSRTADGLAPLDRVTAGQVTLSATPDGAAPDAGSPDRSYAVAIPMQPWTQCTIYPEGDSGDVAHTNTLSAGASGEVRFYPPTQDWGTRLSLDCTLNGSSQGSYLVDLSEASTFKRESQSDPAPHVMGTRPALTGDLSVLSLNSLLQQGYPPRPDSSKDPKGYTNWVQAVTKPVDVFSVAQVTVLGLGFNTYTGTVDCNWTGFVQSANGFDKSFCGIETDYSGTLYWLYEMNTVAPTNGGCASSTGTCKTGIWAGVGGANVNLTSYGYGVVGPTALIQNGFSLNWERFGRTVHSVRTQCSL